MERKLMKLDGEVKCAKGLKEKTKVRLHLSVAWIRFGTCPTSLKCKQSMHDMLRSNLYQVSFLYEDLDYM